MSPPENIEGFVDPSHLTALKHWLVYDPPYLIRLFDKEKIKQISIAHINMQKKIITDQTNAAIEYLNGLTKIIG